MDDFSTFTAEEMAQFLANHGVSETVKDNIVSNKVSGSVFMKLTEDDIRELAPTIGQRVILRDIRNKDKVYVRAVIIIYDHAGGKNYTTIIIIVLYRYYVFCSNLEFAPAKLGLRNANLEFQVW